MNDALQNLAELVRTDFVTAVLVFLRVGAAMALLPAFGERSVPQRIRLSLALAFSIVIFPAVSDRLAPVVSAQDPQPVFLATEVIAGLVIGIVLRLFILALQMAGSIAAQSTSLSQIFGGAAGVEPQPAIGHIMVVAGLALAVITGLHVRIAEVFILSYDMMPAGVFPGPGMLSEWGIGRIAKAFSLAFSLAAPFIVASLIYNVTLGVINRAMPQLMVAFIGAPAITAGGLILLFLVLPSLLSVWSAAFSELLANPFRGP